MNMDTSVSLPHEENRRTWKVFVLFSSLGLISSMYMILHTLIKILGFLPYENRRVVVKRDSIRLILSLKDQ